MVKMKVQMRVKMKVWMRVKMKVQMSIKLRLKLKGEDDGDSEIEEIKHPTEKEPKQEQSMKVKAQVKGKKGKAMKVRRLRVAMFSLLHKPVERKGRHMK